MTMSDEPFSRRIYRKTVFSIPKTELVGLAEYIERTIDMSLGEVPDAEEWRHATNFLLILGVAHSREEAAKELWQLTIEEYARRLRYGFIATLFSVLEDRLTAMCRLLSAHGEGVKLTYDEVEKMARAPRGVERAKKFLEDALRFSFPSAEWNEIQRLEELRHSVVHRDGYDLDGKVEIGQGELLAREPSGRIVIEAGYCRSTVERVDAFFEKFQEANMDKVRAFLDAKLAGRTATPDAT